jgi:hypothetical protein
VVSDQFRVSFVISQQYATKAHVQETLSSPPLASAVLRTATSSALESGVTVATLLENVAQARTSVELRCVSQGIAPFLVHLWELLHGGEGTQPMGSVVHRTTTLAM